MAGLPPSVSGSVQQCFHRNEANSASYPPWDGKWVVAYGLRGEVQWWLIVAVVCLLAANRGSNCSLTRSVVGRIVRCGIISSCQSAATSEIVKHFWATVRSAIVSVGLYLYLLPAQIQYTASEQGLLCWWIKASQHSAYSHTRSAEPCQWRRLRRCCQLQTRRERERSRDWVWESATGSQRQEDVSSATLACLWSDAQL